MPGAPWVTFNIRLIRKLHPSLRQPQEVLGNWLVFFSSAYCDLALSVKGSQNVAIPKGGGTQVRGFQ